MFSFRALHDEVGAMLQQMNAWAGDVDGRLAFVAGAVSWFMIEQSVKWVQDNVLKFVMFSALTAAGIGLVTVVTADEEPVPPLPEAQQQHVPPPPTS